MLALTCERAGLADGMEVLDLGCGWGSLTLYAAERYPGARLTAVSNSSVQREWIEARAPANVTVITADVNELTLDRRFDRVVSVEMFEHMRNYEALLAKVAALLEPDGRLFVHVFCHRELAYPYVDGWMARNFFTAGQMPSAGLLPEFQRDLELVERWLVSGEHYARTSEAWLERLAENEAEIERRFGRAFLERWRVFFLACAELFGYRGAARSGSSRTTSSRRARLGVERGEALGLAVDLARRCPIEPLERVPANVPVGVAPRPRNGSVDEERADRLRHLRGEDPRPVLLRQDPRSPSMDEQHRVPGR